MKFNITDNEPAADRLTPLTVDFQPLNDRLLVRRLDDPANAPSVVIPQVGEKPSRRGVIVRVGLGKRTERGARIPLCVKVGDIIYFGRYTDFDDGELLLVTEQDVVGVET